MERLGESLYTRKHLKHLNVSEKDDAIIILLISNKLRSEGTFNFVCKWMEISLNLQRFMQVVGKSKIIY